MEENKTKEIRLLRADEIDVKVSTINEKGLSLLLYKNARTDMDILDEVFGNMNWKCKYEEIKGNMYCSVSIYDENKKEWIEKSDCGVESNFGQKEKAEASDAFKRSCTKVGIGRELYTAPYIRVPASELNLKDAGTDQWGKKKYKCNDRFEVSQISYDEEGSIEQLVIRHSRTKKVVFSCGTSDTGKAQNVKPTQSQPVPTEQEMQKVGKVKIDTAKVAALTAAASNNGVPIEKLLKLYKVNSLADLTENQFSNINSNWEKIKAV